MSCPICLDSINRHEPVWSPHQNNTHLAHRLCAKTALFYGHDRCALCRKPFMAAQLLNTPERIILLIQKVARTILHFCEEFAETVTAEESFIL